MKLLVCCLAALWLASTAALATPADPKPTLVQGDKPAGSVPAAVSPGSIVVAPPADTRATPVVASPVPPKPGEAKTATAAKTSEVDSLALLEKAVARDSSKVDNLFKLGVMYLDRDRPLEAITVFAKAASARPKDLKFLVNLGAAQDAAGRGKEAQESYRKALALNPSDSIATCRLANSLYSGGKHGESVQLLRELIGQQPRCYCAYFTLGMAFADAGIYREAIRMWKKVVEFAPDSPEAASAKESIEVLEKYVEP